MLRFDFSSVRHFPSFFASHFLVFSFDIPLQLSRRFQFLEFLCQFQLPFLSFQKDTKGIQSYFLGRKRYKDFTCLPHMFSFCYIFNFLLKWTFSNKPETSLCGKSYQMGLGLKGVVTSLRHLTAVKVFIFPISTLCFLSFSVRECKATLETK